ncbi:hypothetical protein DM806_15410 [Sphingobium lactosutens]|uniref:hypothetical protein n=1 Tax=Sphingobium lactosutens TaxID=522773 RepID=UPI0015B7E21A|nr:hypothetical protein [Sphingobium lactosutens]NWK97029.1 hypothetical protein [Sphingobium lactosutens]
MHFDDQMHRYFGTTDLDAVMPEAMAAGIERMRVDLGLETSQGRRFALWSFLFLLDAAPDIDMSFDDPADRDAARAFMDMVEKGPSAD